MTTFDSMLLNLRSLRILLRIQTSRLLDSKVMKWNRIDVPDDMKHWWHYIFAKKSGILLVTITSQWQLVNDWLSVASVVLIIPKRCTAVVKQNAKDTRFYASFQAYSMLDQSILIQIPYRYHSWWVPMTVSYFLFLVEGCPQVTYLQPPCEWITLTNTIETDNRTGRIVMEHCIF